MHFVVITVLSDWLRTFITYVKRQNTPSIALVFATVEVFQIAVNQTLWC
jgi:hypothetical protein